MLLDQIVIYRFTIMDEFLVLAVICQLVVLDVDRIAVVGPRPNFEGTDLLIEWKELDVNETEALVDCRRVPDDATSVVHRRFCHYLHRKVTVSAGQSNTVIVY